MNYIYDVLLNFNVELYDFYEWDKDDSITHIKKIPIVKVKRNIFNDLKKYKVKVDDDFLLKYKNKTEKFLKKNVNKIDTSMIFTDGYEALAILFKKGISSYYSKLLLEEEEELLLMSKIVDYKDFKYEIVSDISSNFLLTRNEKKVISYSLDKISKIDDLSEIEYLYYECFDKKPNTNIELQKRDLAEFIYKTKSNKIYDFYKLVDTKK